MTTTLSPAVDVSGSAHGGAAARLALTTPGRLRLAVVAAVAAVVAFGAVAAVSARAREHATVAVGTRTEPELVSAEGLYASLSDADATAATAFLNGGIEPVARRQRYLRDLRRASSELTGLARQSRGDESVRRSLRTIADALPAYAGHVESARAYNRQGLPLGAAYLRQASTLMRAEILPAARNLYAVEARRLAADYRSGTRGWDVAWVVVTGLIALAVLLVVQLYLFRLTNRVLNAALVAASVCVLVLGGWTLGELGGEQNALARAQREGSDPVQLLSAVRILVLRAQADEGLALVARGGGADNLADLTAAGRVLDPPHRVGLIDVARGAVVNTGDTAAFDDFSRRFARFESLHTEIVALESEGNYSRAAGLAVGSRSRETPVIDRMNVDLGRQITVAQRRFDSSASTARSRLGDLELGALLLAAAAAILALAGLAVRLREYR